MCRSGNPRPHGATGGDSGQGNITSVNGQAIGSRMASVTLSPTVSPAASHGALPSLDC